MFYLLKSRFLPCALASLMLTGCNMRLMGVGGTSEPILLSQGESHSVDLFTSQKRVDTNIVLAQGRDYALDIVTLSHWIDGDIAVNEEGEPLDQRGFDNSQMPLSLLGIFRRSRQHRWFELMLYQPDCADASLRGVTDLEVDASSGSYLFVAQCDGELTLFVNDSYRTYLHNVGYANIALSRIN